KLYDNNGKLTWQLYQKINGSWTPKPSQVVQGATNLLYGRYDDTNSKGQAIEFQWKREEGQVDSGITLQDDGKSIHFLSGDSVIMTYRYALMPVPEGVSQIYSR